MKKIMMSKYGFVRDAQNDFSDDGNHFQVYKAGTRVRVSKLVADGEAYISARIDGNILPYEAYSVLPHYRDLNALNGVSVGTLSEEDLQELYANCLAYEEEYTKAEQTIEMPSLEELKIKAEQITIKVAREVNQVEKLLSLYAFEAASKFSKYDWINLQEYIGHLNSELVRFNPDTYPQRIVGSAGSFNFIENKSYLEEGFWFKRIIDLFKDKGMSVSKN